MGNMSKGTISLFSRGGFKVRLRDYHIHNDYSIDAAGTLEEFCQRALQLGLQEICFTPHYEVDPQRSHIDGFARVDGRLVAMKSDWVSRYLEEVVRAKAKYTGRLEIKGGLEVDFIPGQEEHLQRVIEDHPLDFVLGAVHSLEHIAISSQKEHGRYYMGRSPGQVLEEYYGLYKAAVLSGLFDAMAHMDIYARYGLAFYGSSIEQTTDLMEGTLELIAQRNMALEVNTSGYRQGLGRSMPGEPLLRLAVAKGVKRFTLGSDAHRVEDLGRNLEEGAALLVQLGIREVVTFEKRKGILRPLG